MDLPEPVLLDRTDQPYLGIRRTVTMRTIAEVADRIPTPIGALAQRGSAVPGPLPGPCPTRASGRQTC